MKISIRALQWVSIAISLTACQPLPHPFETAHLAPEAALLSLPEVVGIVVDPVRNVPEPTGNALQIALTKALQDADVPAGTGPGNAHSYHISGDGGGSGVSADGVNAKIVWTITSADGTDMAQDTQTFTTDNAGWQSGAADFSATMPEEADRLAEAIHLPTAPPEAAAPPAPPAPAPTERAVVEQVSGAPGDGDQSLPRALAYVLQQDGVAIEDKPDGAAAIVSGSVTRTAIAGGQEDIKIVWRVSTAKGKSIGTVAQENAVPAGTLDGPWSDAAAAVAGAGGDSIRGLIDQAMHSGHIP